MKKIPFLVGLLITLFLLGANEYASAAPRHLPSEPFYKSIDSLLVYIREGNKLSFKVMKASLGIIGEGSAMGPVGGNPFYPGRGSAIYIVYNKSDFGKLSRINKVVARTQKGHDMSVEILNIDFADNVCVSTSHLNGRYNLGRAFPPESGPGAKQVLYSRRFAHGSFGVQTIRPKDRTSALGCALSITLSFMDPPQPMKIGT